jgi:hypothetical protein
MYIHRNAHFDMALVLSGVRVSCSSYLLDVAFDYFDNENACLNAISLIFRSSINFLAHCSNVCKPLKKHSEGCPSNQVSAAGMVSVSDE